MVSNIFGRQHSAEEGRSANHSDHDPGRPGVPTAVGVRPGILSF